MPVEYFRQSYLTSTRSQLLPAQRSRTVGTYSGCVHGWPRARVASPPAVPWPTRDQPARTCHLRARNDRFLQRQGDPFASPSHRQCSLGSLPQCRQVSAGSAVPAITSVDARVEHLGGPERNGHAHLAAPGHDVDEHRVRDRERALDVAPVAEPRAAPARQVRTFSCSSRERSRCGIASGPPGAARTTRVEGGSRDLLRSRLCLHLYSGRLHPFSTREAPKVQSRQSQDPVPRLTRPTVSLTSRSSRSSAGAPVRGSRTLPIACRATSNGLPQNSRVCLRIRPSRAILGHGPLGADRGLRLEDPGDDVSPGR